MTRIELQPATAGEKKIPGRRSLRRLWPLLPLALVLILFFALDFQRYISLDGLRAHQAEWRAFVDAHAVAAALVYFALFTAIVLCAIPVGLWMSLIGGFLFGTIAAFPMAVLAHTVGATLMFLIARSALGGLFAAKTGSWLGRLEAGFRRDQWSYMFFLRLVPIFPFCTVTVVPAMIGVDLLCLVIATFFGLMPVTLIFTLTGASLGAVLESGQASLASVLSPQLILALAGLGIIAILPVALRRFRRGRS